MKMAKRSLSLTLLDALPRTTTTPGIFTSTNTCRNCCCLYVRARHVALCLNWVSLSLSLCGFCFAHQTRFDSLSN
jgi:hypothetical protein